MSRRKGPPPEDVTRRAEAGHTPEGRDITPAVGVRGSAGVWERAGEKVALAKESWGDSRWSYLYDKDTKYAGEVDDAAVAAAAREARGGDDGAGRRSRGR